MKECSFAAKVELLPQMMMFLEEETDSIELTAKQRMHLELAVEEVLVNVCSYAYSEGGELIFRIFAPLKELAVEIEDQGAAFNPLAQALPDVDTDLENREIGGLGIFLTQKIMDEVTYRREGDRNILRMVLHLNA